MINCLIEETMLIKTITENKNPEKPILDFNEQQKGKGLKISTPKQMLQRLAMALYNTKLAL